MGHRHDDHDLIRRDPLGSALFAFRHPRSCGRGLRDFLGVVLSAMLFTILLARGAGECALHLVDVDAARRAARGELVLQETLEALSAYPYDAIARLDTPSDPDFAVDLGVTSVRNDLLRIEAVVVDNETRQEVGKFVTYRRRS